jgi:hypothetical protein
MTFPQAPSERHSRTRWLKIAAAFWLLLISAVALINSVGLSRLAEQTQSSAQDAQVKALGLRVADLEQQADADKRRPVPISQAEFATARQALDERMTRLEEADEARALAVDLQTLQARVNAIETRLEKDPAGGIRRSPAHSGCDEAQGAGAAVPGARRGAAGRRALSVDHLHRRGLARGRPAAARGRCRGRLATAVHRGAGGRVPGERPDAARCGAVGGRHEPAARCSLPSSCSPLSAHPPSRPR